MLKDEEYISSRLSQAAIYEQLAEECAELAHACLKKSRKLRSENPTPLSMEEIDASVTEEYTDVFLTSEVLGLHIDLNAYWYKYDRWCKSLN